MILIMILIWAVSLIFNLTVFTALNWECVETLGDVLFPDELGDTSGVWILAWLPMLNNFITIIIIIVGIIDLFIYLLAKGGIIELINKFLNIRIK